MGLVQGVCSSCGKKIRRNSPIPIVVTCDCYRICSLCGALMEPYSPDLNPKTYRNEDDPAWDPLANAERDEPLTVMVYVCRMHSPPFFSNKIPMEVQLE